jgi:hypothetical protein
MIGKLWKWKNVKLPHDTSQCEKLESALAGQFDIEAIQQAFFKCDPQGDLLMQWSSFKEYLAAHPRQEVPENSAPKCEECGGVATIWAQHFKHGHVYLCGDCLGPDYNSAKPLFRGTSDPSANARPEQTGIATGTPVESDQSRHEWMWHATGAGSGWCCLKCDTFVHHHPGSGPPPTACPQTGSPFYEPNTYSRNGGDDN